MSNPTTFDSDVTVNKRLFVTDDIVVGSSIATGTTTNYGNVENKKDTAIGNRLFVKKDAKMKNRIFVDSKSYFYNDIQLTGKLRCSTLEVTDGHSFDEILSALKKENTSSKPRVIIFNTVKGKGVKAFEDDPAWHARKIKGIEMEVGKKELGLT